jgi:hypothetical protein
MVCSCCKARLGGGSPAEDVGVACAPVGEGAGLAAEQPPDGVGAEAGGVGAQQGESLEDGVGEPC